MHPDVAISLNNLAELDRAQGAYPKAEPLYVRALDIKEKALGPMHPDVALSLNNLAMLYQGQGAYPKAEPLLSRATDIRESQLRSSLAPLSESRKRAVMTLVQGETERLVSFHVDAFPSSPRARELALTTVLRRKGRVLDSLTEAQRTLRDHLTPPLRDQLDQLAEARSELAAQFYAVAEQRASTQRAAAIATLRTRIDNLEATLSAASAEFRTQNEPVTLANVQAALSPGAMLVELVRYRRFDARAQPPWQEERYVAYLVTSHGPPHWVPLGAAAPIDDAVDTVLAALQAPIRTEATRTALQHLDALVVTPLRNQLTGVSHLILAPDGKLNLVPFEALIDAQGHYELERYLVSYLSSGRDLLRLAAHRASRSPGSGGTARPGRGRGARIPRVEPVGGDVQDRRSDERRERFLGRLLVGHRRRGEVPPQVGRFGAGAGERQERHRAGLRMRRQQAIVGTSHDHSILTLVTVLAGDVQPGHAQSRSSTPTSQAVLDEASRLDKLVDKLYGTAPTPVWHADKTTSWVPHQSKPAISRAVARASLKRPLPLRSEPSRFARRRWVRRILTSLKVSITSPCSYSFM